MIQSKIITELIDIYKQAEKCYECNRSDSFYKCLENKLFLSASKYINKEEILESYRIACKSYLDSHLIEFNISVSALIISIVALVDIKVTIVIDVLLMIAIIIIGYIGIRKHIKRRKLLEICNVLEKICNL